MTYLKALSTWRLAARAKSQEPCASKQRPILPKNKTNHTVSFFVSLNIKIHILSISETAKCQ